MKYKVALHRSDEGLSVSVPALPGCWSEGDTEEEALANIRDAIQEYLAALPCAVHFEYDHKDYIEAQLWGLKSEDQLLFLQWTNGVWKITGTGYGTVVCEGE
jgi:predicted RNase H-like HicB family nuclease